MDPEYVTVCCFPNNYIDLHSKIDEDYLLLRQVLVLFTSSLASHNLATTAIETGLEIGRLHIIVIRSKGGMME